MPVRFARLNVRLNQDGSFNATWEGQATPMEWNYIIDYVKLELLERAKASKTPIGVMSDASKLLKNS